VKFKNRNEEIMLTEDWVEGNFYKEFIEQWRIRQGIWNKVIPGCPKNHEMESNSLGPTIHPSHLKVKFPQANLQTCMLSSFASCLHCKGMKTEAAYIMKHAGEFHISSLFYENFTKIVTNACKPKYTIFRNKKFHFNQDEHLFDIPTMVVLVGKDGSCDHAILVYKDMIFDTSHGKIFKRNSETLDWCCPPLGFQQIHCAYSLMEI